MKITNNNALIITIFGWIFIAGCYLSNTGYQQREYDPGGHLKYTEIILKENRLPKPHEEFQTYHPPVYYITNSILLPPEYRNDENKHYRFIRALSVVYGGIFLFIIFWFLKEMNISPKINMLTNLFICSTPKYLVTFSTYNNDSLATLLGISILALSYKLYHKWSIKTALFLLVISTLGIHTKYNVLIPIFAILIFCCKNFLKFKLPTLIQLRIIIILITSVLFLFPWLIFHNYKYTQKLFPNNMETGINQGLAINDDRSVFDVVTRVPLLQSEPSEWNDPWAHGYTRPESKKHDYWAFSFITSVFSEFVFNIPNIYLIWIILWVHLIANIFGLLETTKSFFTRFSTYFILFSHLMQIAYLFSLQKNYVIAATMDYRFIGFTWLSWAVLYATALSNKNIFSKALCLVFVVSIFIHFYILVTVKGSIT